MSRQTRSGQNGGGDTESEIDSENDNAIEGNHDNAMAPEPMTPTRLEKEMNRRIASLESMIKRQAKMLPPTTPYNDTLLGGQVGSLSTQRTDNSSTVDALGGIGPHLRTRVEGANPYADATLLASSTNLRKQVHELDAIYKQMDKCRERAEALGQEEAQLMFENEHGDANISSDADNVIIMRGLDSTPAPASAGYGEQNSSPQRGGDDLAQEESPEVKLQKIQSMLESVEKYSRTLKQRLRTYLEVTYGLHTTYKEEYQQQTTKIRFDVPEGLGAKPSIYAAQLFRVSLDKHISNYPIQNAPLIPFLYEALGRNSKRNTTDTLGRGETVSQTRWTPPCTTDVQFLESSPYKSFNQRYNRANRALYKVMSQQCNTKVRSFLGVRSNGSHGKCRCLTEGRVDDALSIVCSIVFFHESSSFCDLLILKQQCAGAYAFFGTQPVEQAIKNTRKVLDHAVVLDLKLPWQTISHIIGILIQKNPLFSSYLSPWMEPQDGADPDDCLPEILLFLSTVEHVQQKVKMSIMDVRKKSSLNVYYNNSNAGLFDMSSYGKTGPKRGVPAKRPGYRAQAPQNRPHSGGRGNPKRTSPKQ